MSKLRHYYVQEHLMSNGRDRVVWTSDAMTKKEAILLKEDLTEQAAKENPIPDNTFRVVRDFED